MTVSTFRQDLDEAFRSTALRPVEEKTEAVAEILKSYSLIRKLSGGWMSSTLKPVVSAIWDRSLDDSALAALLACEWFESSLGLNLVARGLLEGDDRALALIQESVSGPIRPPVEKPPTP